MTGWLWPSVGVALEPVGTTFVAAIKMLITPIVFLTIVAGIGSVDSLGRVGRVGLKSLAYFQAGTLVALLVGLIAVNVFQPGAGVHAHPGDLHLQGDAAQYVKDGQGQSWWHFITDLVPESAVGAFAEGNILQVIFFSVLFGIALKAVDPIGEPIVDGVPRLGAAIFKILHYVMLAAPVGAFGAMAYTTGKYGVSTLTSLGQLIGLFYGTSAFFVIVILGSVTALLKINIFRHRESAVLPGVIAVPGTGPVVGVPGMTDGVDEDAARPQHPAHLADQGMDLLLGQHMHQEAAALPLQGQHPGKSVAGMGRKGTLPTPHQFPSRQWRPPGSDLLCLSWEQLTTSVRSPRAWGAPHPPSPIPHPPSPIKYFGYTETVGPAEN
ncbi:cation:dicarboxylase symporter family transporter [Streptomyces sp. NBC_01669]|uniref:cation:dicarboxylate symporter family transporter n=1 Tax=Streptomyces sp. NBC_01669 TaxID=2975909 RepID=UPI0022517B46|nr:cation:dicarboxylase symporter family transporter [Streptomyces sp. NBC_01669]MCX4538549.1 cation:dicarboxylase symporter family transporter [Streptomyces sp. NBC_01669]